MKGEGLPMAKSPKPTDILVGARVRLRRKELGLSQEKLGDKLGITFQQIQKYEKGTNRIGASRLADMSQVLEVPVSYFFEDGGFGVSPGLELSTASNVLAIAGAMDLLRAYSRIPNPRVRKAVLSLARNLALDDSSTAASREGAPRAPSSVRRA